MFDSLKNAGTLEIDFGDGSAKNVYNVKGLSSFTSPAHLFPGPGTYKVSALLTNGTCSFEFNPFEVTFEEEVVKTCQPLNIPIEEFKKLLRELLASAMFIELYSKPRLDEVTAFFQQLAKSGS